MIGKGFKQSSFRETGHYLEYGKTSNGNAVDNPGERVAWAERRNLIHREREEIVKQMSHSATMSGRVERPVYHLVLSWDKGNEKEGRSGDNPSPDEMKQAAFEVLDDLGLKEHQAWIVAHHDTDTPHLHAMVNRVHPVSQNVWRSDFEVSQIYESLRRVEEKYGWYQNGPATLQDLWKSQKEDSLDYWEVTGEKFGREESFRLVARAVVKGDLEEATSWPELEERLNEKGAQVEPRRGTQGMVLTSEGEEVSLYKVSRASSRPKLEARFGQTWERYQEMLKEEYTRDEIIADGARRLAEAEREIDRLLDLHSTSGVEILNDRLLDATDADADTSGQKETGPSEASGSSDAIATEKADPVVAENGTGDGGGSNVLWARERAGALGASAASPQMETASTKRAGDAERQILDSVRQRVDELTTLNRQYRKAATARRTGDEGSVRTYKRTIEKLEETYGSRDELRRSVGASVNQMSDAEKKALAAKIGPEETSSIRDAVAFDRAQSQVDRNAEAMAFADRFFRAEANAMPKGGARTYLDDRSYGQAEAAGIGYAPNDKSWRKLKTAAEQAGFSEEELRGAGLTRASTSGREDYDAFSNQITFPLRDGDGVVRGFTARWNPGEENPVRKPLNAKYVNTGDIDGFDKKAVLYQDTARGPGNEVFVTEGPLDAVAAASAGEKAVALSGTRLSQRQAEMIGSLADERGKAEAIVVLDGDRAGKEGTLDAIGTLQSAGVRSSVVRLQEGQDVDEFIRENGEEGWRDYVAANRVPAVEYAMKYDLDGTDLRFNDLDVYDRAEGRKRALDFAASFPDAEGRDETWKQYTNSLAKEGYFPEGFQVSDDTLKALGRGEIVGGEVDFNATYGGQDGRSVYLTDQERQIWEDILKEKNLGRPAWSQDLDEIENRVYGRADNAEGVLSAAAMNAAGEQEPLTSTRRVLVNSAETEGAEVDRSGTLEKESRDGGGLNTNQDLEGIEMPRNSTFSTEEYQINSVEERIRVARAAIDAADARIAELNTSRDAVDLARQSGGDVKAAERSLQETARESLLGRNGVAVRDAYRDHLRGPEYELTGGKERSVDSIDEIMESGVFRKRLQERGLDAEVRGVWVQPDGTIDSRNSKDGAEYQWLVEVSEAPDNKERFMVPRPANMGGEVRVSAAFEVEGLKNVEVRRQEEAEKARQTPEPVRGEQSNLFGDTASQEESVVAAKREKNAVAETVGTQKNTYDDEPAPDFVGVEERPDTLYRREEVRDVIPARVEENYKGELEVAEGGIVGRRDIDVVEKAKESLEVERFSATSATNVSESLLADMKSAVEERPQREASQDAERATPAGGDNTGKDERESEEREEAKTVEGTEEAQQEEVARDKAQRGETSAAQTRTTDTNDIDQREPDAGAEETGRAAEEKGESETTTPWEEKLEDLDTVVLEGRQFELEAERYRLKDRLAQGSGDQAGISERLKEIDGEIRELEVEQLYREPLSSLKEEKDRLKARMDLLSGDMQEAESRVRRLELEVSRAESNIGVGGDGTVTREDLSEELSRAKDDRDMLKEDVQYVQSRSMMVEGVINGDEAGEIVRDIEAKQSIAQAGPDTQESARSEQDPYTEERSTNERSTEPDTASGDEGAESGSGTEAQKPVREALRDDEGRSPVTRSETGADQTVLEALYDERSDVEKERRTIEGRIEKIEERVTEATDRYEVAEVKLDLSQSGEKPGEDIVNLKAQMAFAKQDREVAVGELDTATKSLNDVNGRLGAIEDKISSVVERLSPDREGDDMQIGKTETSAANVSMREASQESATSTVNGEPDQVGDQTRSTGGMERIDENEKVERVIRVSAPGTADTLREREVEGTRSGGDVKEERLERIAEKSSDVEIGFELAYKNPEKAQERFEAIAFRDGVSDNTASYDAANRALRNTPEVFGEVRGAEMDNRMPNTQRIGALSGAERAGAAHSDMMKERREFQQDFGESVAMASSKSSTLSQMADIDRVERDAYLRARAAGSMADTFKQERRGLEKEFERGVRNVYEDGDKAMAAYETNARAYSTGRARQVMIYPADHLQNGSGAYADPGRIGTKNPDDLTRLVSIDQRLSETEIKEKVARGIQEREQNTFQESYKWNEPTNEASRAEGSRPVSGEPGESRRPENGRAESERTGSERTGSGSLETDAANRETTRAGVERAEGDRARDRGEEPRGRGPYDERAQAENRGGGERDIEDARGRRQEGRESGDRGSERPSEGSRDNPARDGSNQSARRGNAEGDQAVEQRGDGSPDSVSGRVQSNERSDGRVGKGNEGGKQDRLGVRGGASGVAEGRAGDRTGDDGRFEEGTSRDAKQGEAGVGQSSRMAWEERREDRGEPTERRGDRSDEQNYGTASDRRAEEPGRKASNVPADRDVRYNEGGNRDGTGQGRENRSTRSDDAGQASSDRGRGGSFGRDDGLNRSNADGRSLSQDPRTLDARMDAALKSARRAEERSVPERPDGETFFERAEREGVFGKTASEINERAAERRAGETLRRNGVSPEEASQVATSVRTQVSDGATEEKANRMMGAASAIDRSDALNKDATMLESASTVKGYDDALEKRTNSATAFEEALGSRFKSPREAREAFESRVDSNGFERSINDLQERPETFGRLRRDWQGASWKDMENAEMRVETAAQGMREYRDGTLAKAASRSEVQRSVERAVAERKGEKVSEAERQRADAGVAGLQNEYNLVKNERSQLPSDEQSKRELVGMMRSADGQTQERFRSKVEGAVASEERKEAMERMMSSNERVDRAFGRIYSNPNRARIAFEEEAYREGVRTSSSAYKGATRNLYDQPDRFGEVKASKAERSADGGQVGASKENQKEAILASRQYTSDNETLSKMMSSGSKKATVVKKTRGAEKASRSAAGIRPGGPAYQVTRGVYRSMTREIDRY